MNTYAARVMSHYQQVLPDQYATIPDPEAYFSTLGQEIETQVNDLTTRLAGPDQLGDGYLEKVGRLNMAKLQAEETVLADYLVLPEPNQDDEEDLNSDPALQLMMQWHREDQQELSEG